MLPGPGYEELGEKTGEVIDAVVNQGLAWKPLQPNRASRAGAVITLDFDVPNPPLQWDENSPAPHQMAHTAWMNGRGFEVLDGTNELTIASVAIAGSSVVVTLASPPAAGAALTVSYAVTADTPQDHALTGQLRDSDPFVGFQTVTAQATVTQGSTSITGPSGAFLAVAGGDLVTGSGVPAGTVVQQWIFDTLVKLSQPWPGASGTVALTFRHDHRNACVQFAMPVP
jgi:hypothetical protein